MHESIICFSLGLSQKDIEAGEAAFRAMDPYAKKLEVTPVTGDLLATTVGDAVDGRLETFRKKGPSDAAAGSKGAEASLGDLRALVIEGAEKDQVIKIMRGFKSVLPSPQDLIFAMVTQTARTWTFQDYFKHLAKEHEYMKTHSPANDPDMKRM
jgi:hypothetical protein